MASFKDLRVWQEAMKLTIEVYRATADFPKSEVYGLSQQMRRAAVSVPSNIAEGKGHRSNPEFTHNLLHARGSLLELQTQIMLASELRYINEAQAKSLLDEADSIGHGLNGLINSLHTQRPAA